MHALTQVSNSILILLCFPDCVLPTLCCSVVLMDSSACVSRDIKLAGSDSPSEGWVEACVNGTRARVCAENWSSLEVNLVCTLYQFDKGMLTPPRFKYAMCDTMGHFLIAIFS